MSAIEMQCLACRADDRVAATEVPRFDAFLRVMGGVVLVPSLFGFFAAIALLSVANSTVGAIALWAGLAVGSAMLGVVAGVLLSKRKVLRCGHCGFVLDRA